MPATMLPHPAPSACRLPLYGSSVAAGFPSPADDYLEGHLDLNRYLIDDAAACFMVRVSGDSMQDAGIHDGDLLVVNRSLPARHGHIVLAVLSGEFTVKRLHQRDGRTALLPDNPAYPPIDIGPGQELHIWGVVSACVRRLLP